MDYNPYSDDPELSEVLTYIEDADVLEINAIIHAVTRRYSRHFPDHDISFLALPREPEGRKKQLEWMLEQIKAGQLL